MKTDWELAYDDYAAILSLEKNKSFNEYFMRRLHDKREKLADEILNDLNSNDTEIHDKRVAYRQIKEIIQMMQVDKQSCEKTTSGKRLI